MKKKIAVLPGDGIGREIASGAVAVLQAAGKRFGHEFEIEYADIGGAAIDSHNTPLPGSTLELARNSDAVLLGAVGGPKWDNLPSAERPERGLLAIRKELGLFANLRPIPSFQKLVQSSPLKPEIAGNVNMLIVRELTGGLYFGKPSERRGENNDIVVDTLQYTRAEIERIVVKAFEFAAGRGGKLTSVDKANVLESSRMWREIVNEKAADYPNVTVDHMYVDAAAMKLISSPGQFDVIVTENLFGDILSDEASMITGSLGMLPSASLSESGIGLYEPVHGSAPDIAGQNKANPLAMILSAALMLKYSFNMREEGEAIERAVQSVLNDGYCTQDLQMEGSTVVGTDKMIELVTQRVANGSDVATDTIVYM
ncbi:3-isopropylmalate dehydrogenase [Domibacillus mangrovi]|uniref:3-isopropylmalate dehydrogenase n=1 Tax=Domibacillus mangrovi TaxID=1714354 RepID=A0A1Q5P0X1_9BACI|nr:3-isopropylmalate dehydrogenase [Domibacillus mangrovi]OKL35823.1 3-isopropylmalate dehydrogenase [Domibacillus mangrovi]